MLSSLGATNWFLALVSEFLYLPKSKLFPDLEALPNKKMWYKGVADRVEAAFGALNDTPENRKRIRYVLFRLGMSFWDAALMDLFPGVDL